MDAGELLVAIDFAARKHRDQRRKDREQTPYINHPIAVAMLLWQAGVRDRVALTAAILHDTIEDTKTTREEIAHCFGDDVASVVAEVTDDKSLPKARRKELQIEHAPHLTAPAKLVKLADKICNVRDMTASPPHDWTGERREEYYVWSARVVDGLRGTNAELERLFDAEMARRSA